MDQFGTSTEPWAFLRLHTPARIAPGRAGHSLPTRALLDFQLDHARARDAVYSTLDTDKILGELEAIRPSPTNPILLRSQALDRRTYLQRPDLGRKLDDASRLTLQELRAPDLGRFDLSIVMADGLSATAINQHGVAIAAKLVEETQKLGWSLAPIGVVQQGRVAIGDEIAHGLGADLLVVLIGERPGLSSPDSLGAYLTYQPRPGLTDELRNCVSNIRPEGLPYAVAVPKLLYLLTEMKIRRLSGVALKDEMPTRTPPRISFPAASAQNPEIPD